MVQAILKRPDDFEARKSKINLETATRLRDEWLARLTNEQNHLFLDFESYYDDDCSLSKLTNFAYIGHKDFEILSVSIARGRNGAVATYFGQEECLAAIRAELKAFPDTAVIAQNTPFDGTVLAKNKIYPRHFLDLTGMSRAWHKQQMYHNLDAIATRLFPNDPKMRKIENGTDVFKYAREIRDFMQPTVRAYNEQDTNLLRACFYEFMRLGFPPAELMILDLTLQMTCVPSFDADTALLQECYDEETAKQKAAVEAALDYMKNNFDYSRMNSTFFIVADERDKATWKTKKEFEWDYRQEFGMGPVNKASERQKFLSSNDKFAYVLQHGFGVKVPMKESPTARKRGDYELIPALGVGDVEFQHLMAERRDLKIIWEGRIASKSNIAATRAQTLLEIASIFEGKLIMPLKYSGAHTDRFGGGDKVNPQNFQRKSKHRYSLRAPQGMKVHVRDSSNVELRGSAAFCEHHEKLALFEAGGDPYITMANKIFGYTCNKHDNPEERGVGKATELGCVAKGTLVITNNGPKAVEAVNKTDMVWNGKRFVAHGGVIDKGIKSVTEFGLTPNHLVWLNEYPEQSGTISKVDFNTHAGYEGKTLRDVADYFKCCTAGQQEQMAANAVFWMQDAQMEIELPTNWLPEMPLFTAECAERIRALFQQNTRRYSAALHEQLRLPLGTLRRAWDSIEVQLRNGVCSVHVHDMPVHPSGDKRKETASRPNQQRWELRAGKLTACIEQREQSEQFTRYVLVAQWREDSARECVPCDTHTGAMDKASRINTTPISDKRRNDATGNRRLLLWPSDLSHQQTYDIADCEHGNRFTLHNGVVIANCGYGMGKDRFKDYLNAGPLGMPPTFLEDIDALKSWANPYDKVVRDYREVNWPVVEMWRKLERVLIDMTYSNCDYMFGPLRITFEKMTGPNGLSLQYPQLGYRNKQWSYLGAEGWVNLFGGKILENIIQFLCRTIICEQMVMVHAMAEYLGGRCCLQVHDEIVTLIWDEIIDEFDEFVEAVMLQRVSWLPTCPLASEADIHDTYA